MTNIKSADSKNRILEAAAKIFSEKGFNGTRVDDIAKASNLNKAMIYYYFNSKGQLRDELFKNLINEALIMTQSLRKIDSINLYENDNLYEFYEHIFKTHLHFFEAHKYVIKLMLMESLKDTEEEHYLLKFFDIIVREELDILSKLNIKIGNNDAQRLVSEFFTLTLPSLWFSVYRAEWIKYYNANEKTIESHFIKAIWETHINSHVNNINKDM